MHLHNPPITISTLLRSSMLAYLWASAVVAQTGDSRFALDTARRLMDRGQVDSALVLLTETAKSDSLDVSLLLSLSDAYLAKGNHAAWRATVDRVLRLNPKSADAYLRLAARAFKQSDSDSALYFAYSALSVSHRSSPEAYYAIGRIRERSNQPDSAVYYYKRAWYLMPLKELF